MHNAEKYWCKSVEYDIDRIECIVHLMDYYRNNGMHILVNSLYHRFKNYSHDLRDKLFINMNTYNAYELEYNNSISAFYVNDHESGYKCCKTILLNSKNVNIEWKHGIPKVKEEEFMDKGRISIIAWGYTPQVE